MQKLIALLKAPDGTRREDFMAAVLDTAPALLNDCSGIDELIVDLVNVDPGDAEWVRPGEPGADSPDYDAVIEVAGTESVLADAATAITDAMGPEAGQLWMYRTTPMPARVDRSRADGDRSPGIKYIVLCRFHNDLPASAVQRSWAHHVPLALRVHVGADIYIRHWVNATLTPGAPLVEGVTELHFPSWEDMRTRWFVDENGRQQIIQDIGHFLASGTRLYTSEHVLKASGPQIAA